jgi:hypothetical protein
MAPKRGAATVTGTDDDGVNFALKRLKDGREGRAGSVDAVLSKVHALEAVVKRQPIGRRTLASLSLTEAYREVTDLPGSEVSAAIEQVMIAISKNILEGEAGAFSRLVSR